MKYEPVVTAGGFRSTSQVFVSVQTVKKEEEERPVSKKAKRTKEEIAEARKLKIKKKEEEEQNRWRWLGCSSSCFDSSAPRVFIVFLFVRWEEEKYEHGVKWKFLEHNGPYFPPEYQPLPDNVNFFYNGQFCGIAQKVRLDM